MGDTVLVDIPGFLNRLILAAQFLLMLPQRPVDLYRL